jgi:hypothetical protein
LLKKREIGGREKKGGERERERMIERGKDKEIKTERQRKKER